MLEELEIRGDGFILGEEDGGVEEEELSEPEVDDG